jgi:hypothetical protein
MAAETGGLPTGRRGRIRRPAVTRGIIGRADDPQVVAVRDGMRRRGDEPHVLDLSRFPGEHALSVRDGVATSGDVDLAAVRSWYVRSLPLPLPFRVSAGPDRSEVAFAVGRERRSFLAGFVAALQAGGARLVNRPEVMAQHFRKLEQLDALRVAGIPVPATLATNDPRAVRAFAAETGGALVYKPLAGGGRCRRITEADLGDDRLRLLASTPVLFQAEVPGRNLRGYVVDGAVVAGYEIVSAELDYRGAETAVLPVGLPEAEAAACRRAAEVCGMVFTGIDLRRRPDGSFAVLECNPSPMFAGIERLTGATPVSDGLAGLLCAATSTSNSASSDERHVCGRPNGAVSGLFSSAMSTVWASEPALPPLPLPGASPREIRASLHPEYRDAFDRDYQAALAEAGRSLTLAAVLETVEHWRHRAWITRDRQEHRRVVRRAVELLTGHLPPEDEPVGITEARL